MKSKKAAPFQLNPKQLAKDLRENQPLVYPVTTLTGGDGRRRSTVQRVMTGLDLGTYDVDKDAWLLDRDKVVLHLKRGRKPPPVPFELDLRQIAVHLLEDHPLVYALSELPGGAGCRRSIVQRTMTDSGLGTYDAEKDVWVLDRDQMLGHLAVCYASERAAETMEFLAATHIILEPTFREQVLSHFALRPEKGTLADVFTREEMAATKGGK